MNKLVLMISVVLLASMSVCAQQTVINKGNTSSSVVRNKAPDSRAQSQQEKYNDIKTATVARRTTEMTKIGHVDTNLTTSPHFLGWDTIITPTMRYYPPPRPKQK